MNVFRAFLVATRCGSNRIKNQAKNLQSSLSGTVSRIKRIKMVDDKAPGIKEFFKGRDIFITGGSGKYDFFFLSHTGEVSKC